MAASRRRGGGRGGRGGGGGGGELFTIVETSADTESGGVADSEERPDTLPVDVKWFEIPFRKSESDAEEEELLLPPPEREEERADGAADNATYSVEGGGCNVILVAGNGIKHEEEEEEEEEQEGYATSNGCSEASDDDSDIDFSDLEEDEEEEEDVDESASAGFWGEPDQLVTIEPFGGGGGGPRLSLGDDADTLDYFRLLFPDSLFEHMVEQTNNYALCRQRRSGRSDTHWHPTDVREMKAYVGLNILTGINQLPDFAMYWASDIFLGNAGFKKTMTARRFQKLDRNLRLCGGEAEPPKGEPGYDGLYKIRPLLDVVGNTMWDAYPPNRCLAIGECAVAAKGRFWPARHVPSKPLRKGLRVWTLCDSRTGYCHRTHIHVGKPGDDAAAAALGRKVALSLVRGLEGRHHHLFMDAFFTSAPLLRQLLKRGLYSCGPTDPCRRGYPDALRPHNVGKLVLGEFYQCQHGNLVATVARDVRVVSCLSSNAAPGIVGIGPGKRETEDGGNGDCVSMVGLGAPRPLPLLLYQENRRGVDLAERLRESYDVGRPCKKWWRYFLWFYVNLCVVNAYVVLRESRGGLPLAGFSGKQFTQRHFRVRLAQQLIGDYQGARGMERAARKRHADSPLEYGHRLERMSERSRRCRNCTNKGLRHESVFGCKICNVHLCRGGCFSEFHK